MSVGIDISIEFVIKDSESSSRPGSNISRSEYITIIGENPKLAKWMGVSVVCVGNKGSLEKQQNDR